MFKKHNRKKTVILMAVDYETTGCDF